MVLYIVGTITAQGGQIKNFLADENPCKNCMWAGAYYPGRNVHFGISAALNKEMPL